MHVLGWLPASLVLFSGTVFAAGSCSNFEGLDRVCLVYPEDGNQIYACSSQAVLDARGAESNTVETQAACSYWIVRPGTLGNDPALWTRDLEVTTTDDDTDAEHIHTRRQEPDKPWIPQNTRCNPRNASQIQVAVSGWYHAFDCAIENSCFDVNSTDVARAACDNGNGTYTEPNPYNYAPDVTKRSINFGGEPEFFSSFGIPLGVETRCNPVPGSNFIEGLTGSAWAWAADCPSSTTCVDMSGVGACEQPDGTLYIPVGKRSGRDVHPRAEPDGNEGSTDAAMKPGAVSGIQFIEGTRCSPVAGENYVERFNGTVWAYEYNCPPTTTCRNMDRVAVCDLSDGRVFVAGKIQAGRAMQRRAETQTGPTDPNSWETGPPNLNPWDTRCNPANMNEVQRFNGTDWVFHSTCLFANSCKEVNGIGACWLRMNHYILPTANNTIDPNQTLPSAPIVGIKRCDPTNNAIVQAWTVQGWATVGVCTPGYSCVDFSNAGFAVCAGNGSSLYSPGTGSIWLPWRAEDTPTSQDSRPFSVTKCKNSRELMRFNGRDWVPDRLCTHGWKCRNTEIEPHIGGCYASSLNYLDVYRRLLAARSEHPQPARAEPSFDQRSEDILSDSSSDEHVTPPIHRHVMGQFPPFAPAPKFEGMHARRMSRNAPPPDEDMDFFD